MRCAANDPTVLPASGMDPQPWMGERLLGRPGGPNRPSRRAAALALAALLLGPRSVTAAEEKAPPAEGSGAGLPTATAGEVPAEIAPGGVQLGKQPETLLEFTIAGGWLMVPIALCSIVWLAFLAERLIVLRRRRVIPPEVVRAAETLGRTRPLDRDRFRILIEAHPSAAGSILRAALDRIGLPRPEIEHGVNTTAQREIYRLRRNLRLFAIVASVAPLLGLLGTVTGLIQSFREVAHQGLGSGSALAPGIYQALITTAGGLIVAIPSLMTYYWLQSRVDHFVHEMDNLVVDFVEAQRLPEGAASAAP